MIQLTRLSYLVLDAIDGHRDDAQITALVSASYGRPLSAANVAALVEGVQPLGLVRGADGSEPRVRRSNPLSTPGAVGIGYYLFWPAFYTDVTDSYRLGRGGRIRTDLGGLYFNAILAVATVVIAEVTGYDALLLVVATQILQMVRQLLPTIRFDGYHVLADLTGVPDLYHHIKPTLTSLLPWRRQDRHKRALKRWAQVSLQSR
jgi:hypothetical protein